MSGTGHEVRIITTRAEAGALAAELNGAARRTPVVVVSLASGQREPYVDPGAVAADLAGHAQVAVLATPDASWAFSDQMPPSTQVYGGAARVYPVGTDWVHDFAAAPLRFAYSKDTTGRVAGRLVTDALTFAHRDAAPSLRREEGRPASGTVTGVVGALALVDVEGGRSFPATVRPELTVPGLPAERLFRTGMTLDGHWFEEENRFDVTGSLRSSAQLAAELSAAVAVLVRVAQVERQRVVVELVPGVRATVAREHVPGEPADLRRLFTNGDVVEALAALSHDEEPRWDVLLGGLTQAEREAAHAPALLPGGPPWLVRTELGEDGGAEDFSVEEGAVADVLRVKEGAVEGPVGGGLAAGVPVGRGPAENPPAAAPSEAPAEAGRPAEALLAGVAPSAQVTDRGEPASLALERDGLAQQLEELTAAMGRLAADLRVAKASLRTSQERAVSAERALQSMEARHGTAGQQLFADDEDQFRFEVYLAWARQTTPQEKREAGGTRPKEYRVGADFLATLNQFEAALREKVVDVVVEVLTGRVYASDARKAHQLRTGSGGDDPYLRRDDGAVCWRVNLQHKTPQARRLHYWQLRDGMVELSSVRLHDDVRP